MHRYLVFNIGCIECSVSSDVVGTYADRDEAVRVAGVLNEKLEWRDGGQNSFEVFDLYAPQSPEYADALSR
jgi:hypothetical protein